MIHNSENQQQANQPNSNLRQKIDAALAQSREAAPGGNTGVTFNVLDKRLNTLVIPREDDRHLEALVDWVQGTFHQGNYEQVKYEIERVFVDQFVEGPGTRFYQKSEKSLFGIVIAKTARVGGKVEARVDAYLEIPAHALARLTPRVQRLLFRRLKDLHFRCSRVDLTIDDYTKSFRPRQCYDAYKDGNLTGFRTTGTWHESGPVDAISGTFTAGKRGKSGSGKRFMVYDKFLESKGEIDAVRCELSLYSKYAQQAYEKLCNAYHEDWSKIIPGYITGCIDFIDHSVDKNIPRCPRLPFWAEFVGSFASIKLRTEPVKKCSFRKMQNWVTKQVAPTLATLLSSYVLKYEEEENPDAGFQAWWKFFWDTIFQGEERMNPDQNQVLRQIRQEKLRGDFSPDFKQLGFGCDRRNYPQQLKFSS